MSQFLYDSHGHDSEPISDVDFSRAVRLPGGGSTCDVFKTRRQRREVFVKRLKEEFRSNPLYLDALDKEFDIGVNLSHPALPQYREFHRDYIVMDFIDGLTLADMIRRRDPWFADEKHLLYVLRSLVDVVGYLHRRNVVHCDIKPDNIMITANGRNLVLIDFDKCYSDALDDTPGDPGKYGLAASQAGRVEVDFQGIALVARLLMPFMQHSGSRRLRRFIRACSSPDVDCEKLSAILDRKPRRISLPAVISAVAIAVAAAAFVFRNHFPEATQRIVSPAVSGSIVSDSTMVTHPAALPTATTSLDVGFNPAHPADLPKSGLTDGVNDEIKLKAEFLDRKVAPLFKELNSGLDRLAKLKNDTTLTVDQLLEASRAHAGKENECLRESFSILKEKYPGLSFRDSWQVMFATKSYADYKNRASKVENAVRREYDRRSGATSH